jgi:hypothetical protein
LIGWTVVGYQQQRTWPTGVMLGFAILARPDAMLLGAMLVVHSYVSQRRIPWRMMLIAALIVLPWALYASWAFGSILPVTFKAKTVQSSIGWWSTQPPFLVAAMTHAAWTWLALPLAVLGLLPSDQRSGPRATLAVRLFVSYGILHWIAYTVIRAPAGYAWYFTPFLLSIVVGAGWGILRIGSWVADRRAHRARARGRLRPGRPQLAPVDPSQPIAWWVALGGQVLIAATFVVQSVDVPRHYRLSTQYQELARTVAKYSTPGDEVAATEIGYIGYFSGCDVVDIHGLIHPEATPAIARGDSNWWMARRPRFVVSHVPAWDGEPGSGSARNQAGDGVVSGYAILRTVDTDGEQVTLWERAGSNRPVVQVR